MKKVVALCGLLLAAVTLTKAQSPASVVAHSRDFFVVQLSYDMWAGAPDSVQTGGISRGFNFAFMYDFPFKEGSHLSVAPGLGISTSSVFFSDQAPQIGGTAPTLAFPSDSIYKHYKLTTAHLEIPVELRYRQYADNANKGLKVGLGLKFGTLLSAHTKGKKIVGGSKQVDKVSNKRLFQPWRVAATARIGWGNFSVFTAYSLTPLLEKSAGPTINPVQIGLCLSGL